MQKKNKASKAIKSIAALCLSVMLPASLFLSGCSTAMSSGPATDPTPDEAQEETVQPKPLNSSFELGYRIINDLPSECRLTDEEMKNSIDSYISFVNGDNVKSLNAIYGESGTVEFQDGNGQLFRSFNSIRDCFSYLYECHQLTINGTVSGFAQGESYSEFLGNVATSNGGQDNMDTDNPDDAESSDESTDEEGSADEVKFSSGNAANFITSDSTIGVNFPNATITNGENVGSVGISIGGTETTSIISFTTGYSAPSGVSVNGFSTKEVRIRFNNDITDGNMSAVLSNVMILVTSDNGKNQIPVVWTIYDANEKVISSVNSSFDYARLIA